MLWLAFVITSVSPSNLYAVLVEEVLPSQFKRVYSLAEITPEGCYLVGAEYEVLVGGQTQKGFCLLTDRWVSSTLQGDESQYPVPEYLMDKNPEHRWQFRWGKEQEVYLYSPNYQKGIGEVKGSKTNISLQSDKWVPWRMEILQEGTFLLKKIGAESRALGLNWMPNHSRFGTYQVGGNQSVKLYLYKLVRTGVDFPGNAVKPSDGENVVLVGSGKVAAHGVEGYFMKPAESYLLQDGTMAFDQSFSQWQCKYNDTETFFLEDQHGRGLESWLKDLSEQQLWKIENGYVVTATGPTRYLLSDSIGHLDLKTAKDVENEFVVPALLLPCGDSTCFETLDSGLKTLSGSWSALALADLDWTDTDALDLTQISLPVHLLPFLRRPDKNNMLIYVAEVGTEVLPPAWKNVVVCSSEGQNRLWNPICLEDRCSFQLHRPIAYERGQFSYEREVCADKGWETLCLPFDADIPKDFIGEELREISAEEALIFEPTNKVHAHVPLILRCRYCPSDGSMATLSLYSDKGIMVPRTTEPSDFFYGTYHPITIKSGEGYYFLNSSGTSFVRAAKSSHLSPFRGYVIAERPMLVRHKELATGVKLEPSVSTLDKHSNRVYTLDGRCVSSNPLALKYLPRGVYIINGKIFLK